MNSNKTIAVAVAGAVTTIIVWGIGLADVQVPVPVQGAFTTIVSMLGAYIVPNREV